jgi:magnesium chelatase family protein
MFATSTTAAVLGVEAQIVRVEADIASGFPRFTMVGLPDSAVKESEARVRSALRNCGFDFKWDRRITVNLAPAGQRKSGSSFDLATAVGLLAADGRVLPALDRILLVGELALDGTVRGVAGVLPTLLLARRAGLRAAVIPEANHREAVFVPDLPVYPARSLAEALSLLGGELPDAPPTPRLDRIPEPAPDLSDVRGQLLARRALEIAAAGGHNLLYVGPPGAGKTMLARRLPGLLPPLSPDEAVEVATVHSAAGLAVEEVLAGRPFRSPHHTTSDIALTGGGQRPRPGEVSLAHNGVLFLDELPEFRRTSLEVLRQPLEEGFVTVSRHRATVRLPARFQLVAAMNPCPCGRLGAASFCRCTGADVRSYLSRLSGPLLDRIDLHVPVAGLDFDEMTGPAGEATSIVRERVLEARERQRHRQGTTHVTSNALLTSRALHRFAQPDPAGERLLRQAVDRNALTARGFDRLLRVARTIADLAGRGGVTLSDLAEALQFRACLIDSLEVAGSKILEKEH